jgi:HSP20 family protein
MTIVKWKRPFADGLQKNQAGFQSNLSTLLGELFSESRLGKDFANHVPAANISETESQFALELSAPGFQKSDFKIELKQGILQVSAKHESETESSERNYSLKEFTRGSFQRQFRLPEQVNTDAIEAHYENGILQLNLPKVIAQPKGVKNIEVN